MDKFPAVLKKQDVVEYLLHGKDHWMRGRITGFKDGGMQLCDPSDTKGFNVNVHPDNLKDIRVIQWPIIPDPLKWVLKNAVSGEILGRIGAANVDPSFTTKDAALAWRDVNITPEFRRKWLPVEWIPFNFDRQPHSQYVRIATTQSHRLPAITSAGPMNLNLYGVWLQHRELSRAWTNSNQFTVLCERVEDCIELIAEWYAGWTHSELDFTLYEVTITPLALGLIGSQKGLIQLSYRWFGIDS
jgi:hypothetical protein